MISDAFIWAFGYVKALIDMAVCFKRARPNTRIGHARVLVFHPLIGIWSYGYVVRKKVMADCSIAKALTQELDRLLEMSSSSSASASF